MKSLGIRLALVISFVLFGLMVMMGLWIDRQLTQAIQDEEIRQARTHAGSLLASLQTLMLSGQGTLAREWLERMKGQQGIVDIQVLRKDGVEAFTDTSTVKAVNRFLNEERFHRKPTPPQAVVPPPAALFAQALRGKTTLDQNIPGQLTVYLPIEARSECLACHGYDQSPLRGVLKLSLPTAASTLHIENMHKSLWGIAVSIVVILALALWTVLRFSVLQPIARLREGIMRVGRGDRTAKLPVLHHDELGMVSAVFNRMQNQLEANETRIRAVTNNVADAIITIDEHGVIDTVNPAAEKLFGYDSHALLGKNFSMLMPEPERSNHKDYIARYLQTGDARILGVSRELVGQRQDGSVFPMELAISEMVMDDSRYFIGIMRDITERMEHIAQLKHQALHDALTGLPNRTLLADRLDQAIRTANRERKQLALVIMDLDHFKEINDSLGHENGDRVLQDVAHRMKKVLRSSDTVARLGGDEFAVLLPSTDVERASQLCAKLLYVLEQPFELDGHTFLMAASIGISLFPDHGSDVNSLMRRADVAMYVAKRSRRGYAVYESTQDQHSLYSLSLMSDLRAAIENDQLVLCYQPVINLQTHRVSGIEALARWHHPKHGLLYPDEFIPLAEQTGLIRTLTLWVLKHATEQSREWSKAGIELRVAVNLSVRNLHDPHFPDQVADIIANGGVQLSRLRLEITETAIMSDPARALQILNHMGAMGVKISIDDYGTGYSSLSYLKQLPVDELKIDKSFVMGIIEDDNDAVIVRSTIDLAHNIGLKVVAEGVENQVVYNLLSGLHCDAAQGYYMGEAMSAAELIKWLHDSPFGLKKHRQQPQYS
jgi:diguanylate cyclase (GGDEF)-like protein/PAS domain S-box-containing protein